MKKIEEAVNRVRTFTARWKAATEAREAHIKASSEKQVALDAEVAVTYNAKLVAEKSLIEEAAKCE